METENKINFEDTLKMAIRRSSESSSSNDDLSTESSNEDEDISMDLLKDEVQENELGDMENSLKVRSPFKVSDDHEQDSSSSLIDSYHAEIAEHNTTIKLNHDQIEFDSSDQVQKRNRVNSPGIHVYQI